MAGSTVTPPKRIGLERSSVSSLPADPTVTLCREKTRVEKTDIAMLTIGSLFSGIGGLELGLEWSGLGRTAWQVEIDPFCRRVLERHWPQAKRFDDVQAFGGAPADLICGGFPCQDLSPAGLRKGIDHGERSGLWREFARVVAASNPAWVVVENVGGTWRQWVPRVRGDLHRLGYASVPLRVRASDVGAWHQRSRIFVVAHRDGEGELQQKRRLSEERGWFGYRDRHAWTRALESAITHAKGPATDPCGVGARQQDIRGARFRGEGEGAPSFGGSWWANEPDVARVVHGLPARLDRERSLGNAVVPQCAMAVGYWIQEMRSGEP